MSIQVPKVNFPKQKLSDLRIQPTNSYAERNGMVSEPWYFITGKNSDYCLPFCYGKSLGYQPKPHPLTKFQINCSLRDYQETATEKALNILREHGAVLLHMGTGSGKTKMALWLAQQLQRFVLFLHPMKSLQEQIMEEATSSTDAVVWEPTKKDPPKECPQIMVASKWSIKKVPSEFLQKVGVLVVDEIHKWYTKGAVDPLLMTQPEYLIVCSATPNNKTKTDHMLNLLAGSKKVNYVFHRDYSVLKVRTGLEFIVTLNRKGDSDYTALETEISNHQPRRQMVIDLITKYSPLHKMIVLVKRVLERDYLVEQLQALDIKVDYVSSEKDYYENCQVLITTVQKGGTGFDEANKCRNFDGEYSRVLILAASVKDRQLAEQMIGRIRHPKPIVIDLVDSVGMLENHWKSRRMIYQKKKAKIQEISIDQLLN